jgi:hypothetical protein
MPAGERERVGHLLGGGGPQDDPRCTTAQISRPQLGVGQISGFDPLTQQWQIPQVPANETQARSA